MSKIIACIDDAARVESVCDHATWAASRLDAPLEFLHVLERHSEITSKLDASGAIGLGAQELLLEELATLDHERSRLASLHGQQLLHTARLRANQHGSISVNVRQRHGIFIETLVELEHETRLLVLGKAERKHQSSSLLLDQDLENSVRAIQCPILVCPSQYREPHCLVLAFDGSTTGRKMVETVTKSPLLRGLPCHIVTVSGSQSSGQESLSWALAKLADDGLTATPAVLSGEPESALLEYANGLDSTLLIMGAYGHSRIRHLIIGSTTTAILRASPTPVLVLR